MHSPLTELPCFKIYYPQWPFSNCIFHSSVWGQAQQTETKHINTNRKIIIFTNHFKNSKTITNPSMILISHDNMTNEKGKYVLYQWHIMQCIYLFLAYCLVLMHKNLKKCCWLSHITGPIRHLVTDFVPNFCGFFHRARIMSTSQILDI